MSKKNEIRLQDLIPRKSAFTLSQTEAEYRLIPCTAGKLMGMEKLFGSVESMLSNPSAENICKMAMFLMDIESAKNFTKQKVKYVDALTGDEVEKEVGGYLLLMDLLAGIREQYDVYAAVLESMGYNRKKIDEIVDKIINGVNDATNEAIENSVKKKKIK